MLTRNQLNIVKQNIFNEAYLISNYSSEVFKLPDDIYQNINCYAYALGIVKSFKKRLYVPGFTTNLLYDVNSKEDLIFKICEDLENLNIKYTKYGVFDKIKLKKDEYLIQVMYVPKNSNLWIEPDFHFLRRSKKNIWYSKAGWLNQPTNNYVEVLANLDNEELVKVHFDTFTRNYIRVAYFAIKEKPSH